MTIPLRELEFDLFEVLRPRALEVATVREVLVAAAELARREFAPHAAEADADEPRIVQGKVVLPAATGRALAAHAEAGFLSMGFAPEHGGLGMPFVVSQACSALFAAAHVGSFSYALLTQGAANVIVHFGTDAQRAHYLPPMLAGRWFGTMCLSEPQAGSSLADVRTLAEPHADGTYRIRGQKMWISGGEHELGDNIVHLVLARTPQAPPGVKGLSLFIVPRRRDGRDNGVRLLGLNHKMGWRGHVNTAISFGEEVECAGELVGELHRGLAHMFLLMNEARVGIGLAASALGFAGYRYALNYARERHQGRALETRDPLAPQVPIIRHADVRRMLLSQKAWVEGALDLVLYCATLVDTQAAGDEAAQRNAQALLELLTPVVKSWPSEWCLEANKLAIQVAGGAGYTRDLPLERLYRDNRLNPIHEGAYGIHGLDLLGRKVGLAGGGAYQAYADAVLAALDAARPHEALREFVAALGDALGALTQVTRHLTQTAASGAAPLALANATVYLDAFGTVTIAWRWLARAQVALEAQRTATSAAERDFYAGKLAACRHFFRHDLSRTAAQFELLAGLDDTALTVTDEQF
ncbi:MAG: acyl-CoA dehydrogenase [Gammaproteobacteria bacterium]|jgi:alkylation response protein AidB-like acyl-CoA dehydrogenase|nr:acyl-CoA dehydrogenase [Gammaproteobacteria bacterium]NBX40943.1 acyl-CoA dehydrogenase [Gammaproteobacteria bacterium]